MIIQSAVPLAAWSLLLTAACGKGSSGSNTAGPGVDASVLDAATSGVDGAHPDASGNQASQVIGEWGGSVVSVDGQATVTVPEGALQNDVTATIEVVEDGHPGAVGPVYRLGPDGTTFDFPVQLVITYDPSSLGDIAESDLWLARWDSDHEVWLLLQSSTVDATHHQVSARLHHLSDYAVVKASERLAALGVETVMVATDIYVDPVNGDDTNVGGNPGSPLASLPAAASRLREDYLWRFPANSPTAYTFHHVTVHLVAGAHDCGLDDRLSFYSVNIVGEGQDATIVNCGFIEIAGGQGTLEEQSGISDLTLHGSVGFTGSRGNTTATRLTVEGSASGGWSRGALVTLGYSSWTTLSDVTITGVDKPTACLSVQSEDRFSVQAQVTNVRISGCATGVSLPGHGGAGSLEFVGNHISGNDIGIARPPAGSTMVNTSWSGNTVTGNGIGVGPVASELDDFGGGWKPSPGMNILSCNSNRDVQGSTNGSALKAQSNLWDHDRPKIPEQGGNDLEGDVDATGALLSLPGAALCVRVRLLGGPRSRRVSVNPVTPTRSLA